MRSTRNLLQTTYIVIHHTPCSKISVFIQRKYKCNCRYLLQLLHNLNQIWVRKVILLCFLQMCRPIRLTFDVIYFPVDVRWRLHFEFYLSTSICQLENAENNVAEACVVAPPLIDIEPMTWDLPITIIPCNPVHASALSLSRTTSSIIF